MTRQLALTNKKLRGIPRRLRALKRWSESFQGCFPEGLSEQDRYRNIKIPVNAAIFAPRPGALSIRKVCAQLLLDACARLHEAKMRRGIPWRVVTTVCVSDMFSSEICVYTSEAYFQSHVQASENATGKTSIISGRSLAREWGLVLPAGFEERGLSYDYRGFQDKDDWDVREDWYFWD